MQIRKIGEPKLSNRTKNIITVIGLAIIFIPFVIVGVCKAYDAAVLASLENALTSNVTALSGAVKNVATTQKACDASYLALVGYKDEAKLAKQGTGNPCTGF